MTPAERQQSKLRWQADHMVRSPQKHRRAFSVSAGSSVRGGRPPSFPALDIISRRSAAVVPFQRVSAIHFAPMDA